MELFTNLYEHQKKCVEKLRKIKIGALYMEQGTGKTRTALELIKIRLEKGRINHVLWLCPYSVKESLQREIIKHAGDTCKDLITICGIETLSSSIRVNSELLELVKDMNCYLIVDESNLVKNFFAKRTKNIIRLSEYCKYKLILNGTPISRNEVDLFAQWYILDWRVLGYKSFWSFAGNHIEYDEHIPNKINRCLNVDYLSKKISPYSYQVKKSECLDLPEKSYSTKYYNLTKEQYKHYEKVANDLMFDIDELEPHTIYRMFTALQNVISGYKVNVYHEIDTIKQYDMYECEYKKIEVKKVTGMNKVNFFVNIESNPRIQKLIEIIDTIAEKTIIFCKYTDEIKNIATLINNKYGKDAAIEFYGELNIKQREKNLKKFKNESKFLIANKSCAGYGLNLQFCSYIIYYSNDWDYATRAQSEDRVHRIGQNKNVHIIDICAAYTLDEKIIKCLKKKENLVNAFKREIDNKKDNCEDIKTEYIKVKNSFGKKVTKKIKGNNRRDLIEGI